MHRIHDHLMVHNRRVKAEGRPGGVQVTRNVWKKEKKEKDHRHMDRGGGILGRGGCYALSADP